MSKRDDTRDLAFFSLGAILATLSLFLYQKRKDIKFTLYRIPYRGGSPIKRHPHKSKPKGGKKLWPPPHPGGRPAENVIDEKALELIRQGMTPKQAWNQIKADIFPQPALEDNLLMRQTYNSYLRRIKRKRKDTKTTHK